ncbi:MAG: FIST C-terminal domain-containing protein [Polyangiaceae bacterium]|nr:FIST C-terminal domain-containing protein [Polyangiaceae bacterium]
MIHTTQHHWSPETGWSTPPGAAGAQLALVFGAREALSPDGPLAQLGAALPGTELVGCSTAGEIHGTHVTDGGVVVTTLRFEHSSLAVVAEPARSGEDSRELGLRLAAKLDPGGLRHVFVLSDGTRLNGGRLAEGMASALPSGVAVTGGLAGDAARFEETRVIGGGMAAAGRVVAVGLYGQRLRVGFGSLGGWDSFGPVRLVTRSEGNVLYELDGRSALALYKEYLGDAAAGLPASALLFPLSITLTEGGAEVVRTILSVDEATQSMTFAGDVPRGAYARLMKANFDRLIDGAVGAARSSYDALGKVSPELAILISCVGRKLVLKQRIEEEVEGVRDVLGPGAMLAGFYSYGEISPLTPEAACTLHNQTMTITTLSEV